MSLRLIAWRAASIAFAVLLVGVLGCRDDDETAQPTAESSGVYMPTAAVPPEGAQEGTEEPARALQGQQAPAEQAERAERALETSTFVAVSPQGTEFEPPIDKDRLPPGAWYCGTDVIHYAVMDEGQGNCAVCKMPLHQWTTREASSR